MNFIIKTFIYISIVIFALFQSGCYKYHTSQGEISPKAKENKIFTPKFTTFDPTKDKSIFHQIAITYSPTEDQLQQYLNQMKFVETSSHYARSSVKVIRQGNRPEMDYSIFSPSGSDSSFIITFPVVKDNKITVLINYIYRKGRIIHELVYAQSIKDLIMSNRKDLKLNRNIFYNAAKIQQFSWLMFKEIDSDLDNWLKKSLHEFQADANSEDVCVTQALRYCFTVPLGDINTKHNNVWMKSQIFCSPYYQNDCITDVPWTDTLGWGGGPSVIVFPEFISEQEHLKINEDLINTYPEFDPECLRLLTLNLKKTLLNMHDPCDPNRLKAKVTEIYNQICLDHKNRKKQTK